VLARSPVVANFESTFIKICVLTFWVGREGSGGSGSAAMDLEEEEEEESEDGRSGRSADEHGNDLPEGWALGQSGGRKKVAFVWNHFLKLETKVGNKFQVHKVMWVPGA
jgi:hypothetical protein